MLQEERFNKILEELAENGAVKNVDLSRSLGVSESTVRRDINELDEMGKLKKVFGGAIGLKRPVNTKEDDVVTKASAHVREKDAIARYAAELIRDDDEEIVNHSNDVYILADSSKFEQVFAVTFTKLKGKCIITDRLDNDLYRKHAIVKEVNK